MIKHYVCILYPGLLFANESKKEIKSRKEFVPPESCNGYYFYDVEEVTLDGEKLQGKPKNHSNTYYVGEKYSVDEIKRLFPDKTILIANLESNGHGYACLTRHGNWYIVDDSIRVIGVSDCEDKWDGFPR